MSLFIKDTSVVPAETAWRYPHIVPGHFITNYNYNIHYQKIVEVYLANNVNPPTEDEVTKWMCENLYISCYEGKSPLVNNWVKGIPPPAAKGCCGARAAPATPPGQQALPPSAR